MNPPVYSKPDIIHMLVIFMGFRKIHFEDGSLYMVGLKECYES